MSADRLIAALDALAAEVDIASKWHHASRSPNHAGSASVFGSARTRRGEPAYELARELGSELAACAWLVVTGGGPGIMQAARDGSGQIQSRAVRVNIPGEEPETHLDTTRTITVTTFALRKLLLIHDIDALFVFPGGVGTLDELFEVLVQQDTGMLPRVPIVLVEPPGGRLWDALLRFLAEHLLTTGLASPSILDNVAIARSVPEALDAAHRLSVGLRSAG